MSVDVEMAMMKQAPSLEGMNERMQRLEMKLDALCEALHVGTHANPRQHVLSA
jgi:hypothetical protein